MNPFVWFLIVPGAILLAVFILCLGYLAWCWTRDQWDKRHFWLRKRRAPGLPRDGWLSWEEQEWLKVIEAGYGDAPKALLRRLR